MSATSKKLLGARWTSTVATKSGSTSTDTSPYCRLTAPPLRRLQVGREVEGAHRDRVVVPGERFDDLRVRLGVIRWIVALADLRADRKGEPFGTERELGVDARLVAPRVEPDPRVA